MSSDSASTSASKPDDNEQTRLSFETFFSDRSIEIREPRFNLQPVAPPTDEIISQAEKDLEMFLQGDQLNKRFVEWVKQVGPGTLGRAQM
jgi:hypothetical protein